MPAGASTPSCKITPSNLTGLCLQGFVSRLGLTPGQRVLDIGCGIGGSGFYMAQQCDVYVHGVDLSVNMVLVALDRAAANDKGSKVQSSACHNLLVSTYVHIWLSPDKAYAAA